jgi:integrase/recombinase XerD
MNTSSQDLAVIQPAAHFQMVAANCDDDLVDVWLRQLPSDSTRASYSQIVAAFRAFVAVDLRGLKIEQMNAYKEHLATILNGKTGEQYAVATQATHLKAIKSLLSFAHKTGYLAFNVGSIVKASKPEEKRAERILSEEEVLKMVLAAQEKTKKGKSRNELLIRFIYRTAARASEVVGLQWRQLQPREGGGQVSFFGKGRKTRSVLVPEKLWNDLIATRGDAPDDAPVFTTYAGGISRVQVWRIVKQIALISGARASATTHSLRHGHASHALDHGASLVLVRDTLGHANLATTNVYAHARPGESSGSFLKVG